MKKTESTDVYITTTLPYVNADPHIGFALEIVQADIIARYHRLIGNSVFFNTGTDEHGQKILAKAEEEKKDVQKYVDYYAEQFKKLKQTLNLSNDTFVRTTDRDHIKAAQHLWNLCLEAGDIYKKKYKGLYCVGDEAFVKEADLVNGKCPNHPNMELVEVEEENYFFKLSAYQDKIKKYLSKKDVIIPDWRREEALTFVGKGLEDFSISREKSRMSWGVPVPNDDTQVMYVWFDALTNYISTLGWPEDKNGNFEKFWNDGLVIQTAGKDQVRFQSIMWQAMLISAGIKQTDKVMYHGFITSGGQKMSKSLGNVIDPLKLVEEYGTDALRFFLARHVGTFEDSDFTIERFKEAYNADLANGIGNLTSRIMKMATTHIDTPVKVSNDGFSKDYTKHLEKFEIQDATKIVWESIKNIDTHIQETEPFKLVKTNKEKAKKIITKLVHDLYTVAIMLEPIIPDTSARIKKCIEGNVMPEKSLFPRKD